MKHPVTTNVAHGCCACKKIIRAGDKHYFDSATRTRYHVTCDPEALTIEDAPKNPRPQTQKGN